MNLHAIEQMQFWGQRRVDGVEAPRHRAGAITEHRFDGVVRSKFDFHTSIDMRTGERRLAARAWVGAASSARANAHRAAAILSVYNESFATAYSNSDAQRCKSSLALKFMEVS